MGGLFAKKTIKDVPIEHHTVLMRADYNVPLNDDDTISDDYRLVQSLPTLYFLIRAGCKIVVISHLGRPDGKPDKKFSLEPVAVRLGELLGRPVGFVPDCIGDRVKVAAKHLKPGQVLLLENLRFYPQEEANDPAFAKNLAVSSTATYFVQDAFGAAHRAHASLDAITHALPSVAGLLLEREVSTITKAMQNPERPFIAVLGGAKVSDKISVIERFIQMADKIIVGGAIANTIFKYKGLPIGKSVHDAGQEQVVESIYAAAAKKVGPERVDEFIILPTDVAVAPAISPGQQRTIVDVGQVTTEDYILDLGPKSTEVMVAHVQNAHTVVWSGTLGMTEQLVFAYSSAKLATVLAQHHKQIFSVVGGGDTTDFVLHWDARHGKSFDLVSTGGSASLELMAGQTLPGVAALLDK